MESIMQQSRECYFTGRTDGLECHHVFYGGGRRKLSELYGLTVWLTHAEHNEPPGGVHFNKNKRRTLEQDGQRAFEKAYSYLDFVKIFGRNYL